MEWVNFRRKISHRLRGIWLNDWWGMIVVENRVTHVVMGVFGWNH